MQRHWLVDCDPDTVVFPPICACCLRDAETSRRVILAGRHRCVIVPYCSACARHAARPIMLRTAAVYGSLLLAVFGGILLSASWDSRWGTTAAAVLLSLFPWGWSRWIGVPRQLGHAARGAALHPRAGGVACASKFYADLLSLEARRPVSIASVKRSGIHPLGLLGPVVALMLTPALHQLFFPTLRVVNFTDRTIWVVVDERNLGSVEPTSGESPAAGALLRAPLGLHRLRAVHSDGSVASDVHVKIHIGARHLYAPGAKQDCFYLQRVSYGRSQFEGEPRQTMTSAARFWVVPDEVDLWFTPELSLRQGSTTGGVVTLLRMDQCR